MVWFYGISNIVGYLMPNPFYTYILDILFLITLLNELIFHTVKRLHLFLSNTNNSSYYGSFVIKTVLFQTVQIRIINKVKLFQVVLTITNNSIIDQSFVYALINVKTVLF